MKHLIQRLRFFTIIGLAAALISTSGCDSDKASYVTIETSFGNMTVELYNSTPEHRDNFIKLVKDNFYEDLLFHRVIRGFMVQGGDPQSRDASPSARLGSGGPGYTIPAEIGAPHFKGTLAAARTGGASNPTKRSSGSQFYLVQGSPQSRASLEAMAKSKGITYNEEQLVKYETLGGTPALDVEYTVFGEVISGIDIIDKIAAVQTAPGDRPIEDVKMNIRLGK